MLIIRLQVEEGFLDGLDMHFSSGLNVLIGARGTGKTSVIELIRFCLGAPAFTDEASTRGRQQALTILQDGQVTVTLSLNGEDVQVRRSAASGDQPLSHSPVTVLAQNEVEAVGAQVAGRRHLLDRLIQGVPELQEKIRGHRAELRSLAVEAEAVLQEGRALSEQLHDLPALTEELTAAVAEQTKVLEVVQATAADQEQLSKLQLQLGQIAARDDTYGTAQSELSAYREDLEQLIGAPALVPTWPESAGGDDLLAESRLLLSGVDKSLRDATATVDRVVRNVEALAASSDKERRSIETAARALRGRLEKLQAGASTVTRQVTRLKERQSQLEAVRKRLGDRRDAFRVIVERRQAVFDQLLATRDEMFNARQERASALTEALGPQIRVSVLQSGAINEYANAIVAGLRGSGLHYKTLAPILAQRMSPLELVEAVEWANSEAIADATGISQERADSVLRALSTGGTADILAAEIDDVVRLELLDGSDYKKSSNLSIGQRCTTVLPLLLSRHGDILILDQPEDHLDNAFIAETLVATLKHREPADQFIFSSHNANIPVLGEADRIFLMGSDGKRGYLEHAGDLDAPESIEAVNRVMEGGRQAFAQRARFYEQTT